MEQALAAQPGSASGTTPRSAQGASGSCGAVANQLSGGRYRSSLGLGAFAGLTAAIWAVFIRSVFPDDLGAFLNGARRVLSGNNPYQAVHSVLFTTGHAFVYPYLVAWAFAPLAVMPGQLTHPLYELACVMAVVAACYLLRPSRPLVAASLVLVCSATIISFQMGTVNAFLLLGLSIGWAYRDRPWVSGIALGLTAVTKLFLAPTLAWLLITRRYRAAAIGGAVFAAVLGSGFAVGPLSARSYLSMLTQLANNESSHGWSLTALLEACGAGIDLTHVLTLTAGAGVFVGCWLYVRRGANERVLFAGAVVASLLACPIVWASYLPLLLAPLLTVADDLALVVALGISWAVVIPDRANAAEVAAGLSLAVAASAVALAPQFRARLAVGRSQPLCRLFLSRRRLIAAIAASATALASVMLIAPAALTSPLPAVLCSIGTLAFCWRCSREFPAAPRQLEASGAIRA